MTTFQILLLAIIQGAAELLPVSSSAHVIVAEKLMGLDPASPEMTFLLVMLHTGTMFAVLLYFWRRWKRSLGNELSPTGYAKRLMIATIATGILGYGLKIFIEKVFLRNEAKAEIEMIFGSLPLIGTSLFAAGLLIILAGRREGPLFGLRRGPSEGESALIGLVQGLCLPFRGFSRSGATISTAMLLGVTKDLAEDFSFALAVILTPPVIARELHRLMKASQETGTHAFSSALILPGLLGMFFSFLAGLIALRWLSTWIDQGRWRFFGYYCLGFSLVVWGLHFSGRV